MTPTTTHPEIAAPGVTDPETAVPEGTALAAAIPLPAGVLAETVIIESALTERVPAETVLADVAELLRDLLDEYGLEDAEIAMETRFHDDLELESIDLVTLAGRLEERYGGRVNFAEFIAELDLEEIIALTVGRLVEHVAAALSDAEEG